MNCNVWTKLSVGSLSRLVATLLSYAEGHARLACCGLAAPRPDVASLGQFFARTRRFRMNFVDDLQFDSLLLTPNSRDVWPGGLLPYLLHSHYASGFGQPHGTRPRDTGNQARAPDRDTQADNPTHRQQ